MFTPVMKCRNTHLKNLPASPTIETHLQSVKMLQVIVPRLEMDIALSLLFIMATLPESVPGEQGSQLR